MRFAFEDPTRRGGVKDGDENMPIKVICSDCGGTGKQTFLYLTEPYWRTQTCPGCLGSGRVEVLSFRERQAREAEPPETILGPRGPLQG